MRIYSIFLVLILLYPTIAFPQPPGVQEGAPFIKSFKSELSSSYEYGFDTDLDGGGEFNINRFSISGDLKRQLGAQWSMSLDATYGFTDYDFSGSKGLAGLNPWGLINRAGLGLRVNYQINENWGVGGGPFIRFRGESGADFGDSLTGGGTLGFTYSRGRTFLVGAGVFIASRLEDDVLVVPGAILNWQITNKLRLSSLITGVKTELGPRVRLSYDLARGFGIAATGGYEFGRFRLDKDGVAPNGVGDVKVLPVWGSIYYDINKALRLEFYSGAGFLGEMELEDRGGDRIEKEDFDTLFFLGGGLRINI